MDSRTHTQLKHALQLQTRFSWRSQRSAKAIQQHRKSAASTIIKLSYIISILTVSLSYSATQACPIRLSTSETTLQAHGPGSSPWDDGCQRVHAILRCVRRDHGNPRASSPWCRGSCLEDIARCCGRRGGIVLGPCCGC